MGQANPKDGIATDEQEDDARMATPTLNTSTSDITLHVGVIEIPDTVDELLDLVDGSWRLEAWGNTGRIRKKDVLFGEGPIRWDRPPIYIGVSRAEVVITSLNKGIYTATKIFDPAGEELDLDSVWHKPSELYVPKGMKLTVNLIIEVVP